MTSVPSRQGIRQQSTPAHVDPPGPSSSTFDGGRSPRRERGESAPRLALPVCSSLSSVRISEFWSAWNRRVASQVAAFVRAFSPNDASPSVTARVRWRTAETRRSPFDDHLLIELSCFTFDCDFHDNSLDFGVSSYQSLLGNLPSRAISVQRAGCTGSSTDKNDQIKN